MAEAVSRSELFPAAGFAIVCGVKTAVTPAGKPVTVRLSAPENPFVTAVPSATTTLPPCAREAAAEPGVIVNPLTTIVTTTVGAGVTPLPVPVTVIG